MFPDAARLIEHYGYGAVALAVGIESLGIPFPGESTLIAAALYAGTTHRMDLALVITAASLGAVVGDNIGFWIGSELGYRLLRCYGRYVHLTDARIKLGQYLFMRHGGKVVFFGRFVAVLRALAALLAGANCMSWPRFLFFNAAGGIVWACAYGGGAYLLGKEIHRLAGPIGIGLAGLAALLVIGGFILLRRHERQLEEEAERAFPGPLRPSRKRR